MNGSSNGNHHPRTTRGNPVTESSLRCLQYGFVGTLVGGAGASFYDLSQATRPWSRPVPHCIQQTKAAAAAATTTTTITTRNQWFFPPLRLAPRQRLTTSTTARFHGFESMTRMPLDWAPRWVPVLLEGWKIQEDDWTQSSLMKKVGELIGNHSINSLEIGGCRSIHWWLVST